MQMKTLPDILQNTLNNHPDNSIGYVNFDGEINFKTYADLYDDALNLLTSLSELNIKAGNKIILALNKNQETISMLWACILGGIIPTILQPPVSFSDINPAAEKILKVYKILGNPKVIISDDIFKTWKQDKISKDDIKNFTSLSKKNNKKINPHKAKESDIAYIQYSSGSTGDPKGILLTHENILANIQAISIGSKLTTEDRYANWMPLYHDMGLIGFHITPLYKSANQFHIQATDFIKRPFLWLDLLTEEKISSTGCPNFGQALILRHLKRKKSNDWDFTNLRVIFNGAEPISHSIMNDFIESLKPFNLKPEAMFPVYGMAESTLAISFSELTAKPLVQAFNRKSLQFENLAVADNNSSAQKIVSVGKPIKNIEIRIVDDDDNIVENNNIGHIQIKGKSVTPGYYNNDDANKNVFCDGWFRTGDLGFFYDDELFITGRYKDIIFINGQNFYAHDLEGIALKYENINFGKIVFGGAFDEKLSHDILILFLVGSINNKTTIDTFKNLKKIFSNSLGISIDVFIPIRSNQIPKTSSGKIQRYKLISQYLKGDFDEIIKKTSEIIS